MSKQTTRWIRAEVTLALSGSWGWQAPQFLYRGYRSTDLWFDQSEGDNLFPIGAATVFPIGRDGIPVGETGAAHLELVGDARLEPALVVAARFRLRDGGYPVKGVITEIFPEGVVPEHRGDAEKRAAWRNLTLIQDVCVRWHKASRGGPRATARNRAAEALPLPPLQRIKPWPETYAMTPMIEPAPESDQERAPDVYVHHALLDDVHNFQELQAPYPAYAAYFNFWIGLRSSLPALSVLHLPSGRTPPLTLTGVDGKLRVGFAWRDVLGAPSRAHNLKVEELTLEAGQWFQIQYNGRYHYGYRGQWFYEKNSVNIGYIAEFTPDLFVSRRPIHRLTNITVLL